MIDSFGKFPSGILQGNLFFPGSYDECLATTVINGSGGNQQQNIFNPKYCQINFPAEQVSWNAKKILSYFSREYLITKNKLYMLPKWSFKNKWNHLMNQFHHILI